MALIIAAKRTAFGQVNGLFGDTPPQHLVAPLIQALIKQTHAPVDYVILGNVLGDGNIARLSMLQADLGVTTSYINPCINDRYAVLFWA